VLVFSPDDSEFAEIRFRLSGTAAAPADFLAATTGAFGRRNGRRDDSWPAFDFREVFHHGGITTSMRRMVLEEQPEFFGTPLTAPGRQPGTSKYAHIVHKRNTTAPQADVAGSMPGSIRDDQVPAYASAIAGRRQIMTSFRFLDAGPRPEPSLAGRWRGTAGSAVALDITANRTFMEL
jgi:hypothetical protein